MITTRRTTMTLDHSTYKDIDIIREAVDKTLGTRLSMARVVCMSVRQFRQKVERAATKDAKGNG